MLGRSDGCGDRGIEKSLDKHGETINQVARGKLRNETKKKFLNGMNFEFTLVSERWKFNHITRYPLSFNLR